jgi:hypothetical protein
MGRDNSRSLHFGRDDSVVVEKPGQQVSPLRFAPVEMTEWWEW